MRSSSNNPVLLNDAVFNTVLQELAKEVTGKTSQPQLIVGAAGSGKTFLMRRLFDAASSIPGLEPVRVDGRVIFSNEDLLLNAGGQRSVLFVDDFDYYLQRVPDSEQFALRGTLSQKGGPVLIASVSKVVPQLTNYEAAFFEGFRFNYLRPLSDEELKEIIGGISSQSKRAERLMTFLPKTPRAANIVRAVIHNSGSAEEDMACLKQYISPLYQAKYESLLPQQQRIMNAIAGESDGLQLSGIRRNAGQETGKISPYLTQMVGMGLVTKESQSARGGRYKISDPLFDLWLMSF